jgi:hypothetical protein
MQTGHPQLLELIGVHEGDLQLKQELHRKFSHLHARGEWFREAEDLRTYMESHTTPVKRRPKGVFRGWEPTDEDVQRREYWKQHAAKRKLQKIRR